MGTKDVQDDLHGIELAQNAHAPILVDADGVGKNRAVQQRAIQHYGRTEHVLAVGIAQRLTAARRTSAQSGDVGHHSIHNIHLLCSVPNQNGVNRSERSNSPAKRGR